MFEILSVIVKNGSTVHPGALSIELLHMQKMDRMRRCGAHSNKSHAIGLPSAMLFTFPASSSEILLHLSKASGAKVKHVP